MRAIGTVLLLAATVSVSSAAAAPSAGTRASLRVVDLTPVTVQGRGFRPGERVRVVFSGERRIVRITRASRSGTFFARFAGLYAELCSAFQLRATGTSGAVAVATRKRPLSCAAPDPLP